MGDKKNHTNGLNLMVMGATIITSLVCYNAYKPNAYEISVNGNCVAYVNDKSKAEAINSEIINDINKRFGNMNIKNDLTYKKVLALDSALCNDETVRKNILSVLDIKVKAVEMKVDGKKIGIIANESEGKKIIELVGRYYLSKSSLGNEWVAGVRNKVTYIPQEVHITSVESPEKLADNIIEKNQKGKPDMIVETTGTISEKMPVSFSTVINWTDTLMKGQSKQKSKGEDGSKIVEKQIIMLNGKKYSEKILKENIVTKPKDAVILKGTKESLAASSSTASMIIPSRGSITSAFGARWGKTHEGIDIGASMGDPIYAVMDGTVIYAGWESGYGNVIKLTHNGSIMTIYGHCSSLAVKVGQKVTKGQEIGKVGSTGNSTGPHLHFEVRLNGVPQDPAKYLYSKTAS